MKLVKMRILSAGPDGVKEPGKVYPVDDKTAVALVKSGAAEYVDPPVMEKATAPELPERAVKPEAKAADKNVAEKEKKAEPAEKAAKPAPKGRTKKKG